MQRVDSADALKLTDPSVEPAGSAIPAQAQLNSSFLRPKGATVSMRASKSISGQTPRPALVSATDSARPANQPVARGANLLTGARENARETRRFGSSLSLSSDGEGPQPRASTVDSDAEPKKKPFCSADVDTTVKLQEKAVVSIYDEIGKVKHHTL